MASSRLLNIGSGPYYTPGWVNVDRYAEDADVKCNAFEMPFKDGTFERVYMGHFLEHIPYDDLPRLLKEVKRVCVSRATILVVGPCLDKAIAQRSPQWLLEQIAANPTPEMPGAGHEWSPTTDLTLRALRDGGLDDVVEIDVRTVTQPTWPNRVTATWQVAARGIVP